MAQSANTVTQANPTPPTNLSTVVGNTPPLDPAQPAIDDGYVPGTSDLIAVTKIFAAKTAASNTAGAPGAGISNDAEGKGTETSVTQSYPSTVYAPVPLTMVGAGPAATAASILAGPNASHASSLSPATNPALASIAPTTAVSGASGTDSITLTGTNFTKQSVAYVTHANTGITTRCATTFTSATSLTAVVPKRTAAGASTITVITGGVVTTLPQTLTYT